MRVGAGVCVCVCVCVCLCFVCVCPTGKLEISECGVDLNVASAEGRPRRFAEGFRESHLHTP